MKDNIMKRQAYRITRDLDYHNCYWFKSMITNNEEKFFEDEIVWEYTGCIYGCISPNGIAITIHPNGDGPFTEIPKIYLEKID